ncbi:substrate-binding domain-containing protein [Arcanobacterium hippocoleae]
MINTGTCAPDSPNLTTVFIDERPGVAQILSSIDISEVQQPVIVRGPGDASGHRAAFLEYFPKALNLEAAGWSYHDGYTAGAKAAAMDSNLIFAPNEQFAAGLLHYFQELGTEISPRFQLFALGGIGQNPIFPEKSAQLTTVVSPLLQAAQIAVDLLISHLSGERELPKGVYQTLQTSAQLRETTIQLIRQD